MVYLDTSFIAPFYIEESTSQQIEQFLLQLGIDEIAISYWTYVEFSSLVARRLRMGEINQDHADQIMAMFEYDMCLSFNLLMPSISDYELACKFLQKPNTGLRAGDALHLAIAHQYQLKFYTLDKLLVKIAPSLNIKVNTLENIY